MKHPVPLLGLALAAAAAASAGVLSDTLQARQVKLDQVLARSTGELKPADRAELGRALAELIDFAAMGQAALGEEWSRRGEPERKDYLQAFEDLVRANSLRRVDVYRADSIEYGEERIDGDQGNVVTTVRSKNATTEIRYSFRRLAGLWRLVDYAIDGVSTVRNYQAQFAKLVEKRGFAGLVERMKKRAAEIEAEP